MVENLKDEDTYSVFETKHAIPMVPGARWLEELILL